MRRYRGFASDSERWARFPFRPDDIVISTPSKSGTTWMQTIVGSLVLNRVDLGSPIGAISFWLDSFLRSEDEAFAVYEAQDHRRFIKTHTPLDGLPHPDGVTFIAVIRHPLDIALSDKDHVANQNNERTRELWLNAVGPAQRPAARKTPPEDPGEYLRWWIDNDIEPTGTGPHGLSDYCHQVRTYWEARHESGVHLFHYSDLWDDLEGEMRRVAAALNISIDERSFGELVEAATLDSMRSRAEKSAPDAHLGIWLSSEAFFKSGGTRNWASLLSDAEIEHFENRLIALAGDAAPWALGGRASLR